MPPLPKSALDVEDLHNVLLASGYIPTNIQILLNSDATWKKIDAGLDWLAHSATGNSTAIIYFSGHGIRKAGLSSGDYLCPVEATLDEVARTLIESKDLIKAINRILAERLVIFLDSCHAEVIGEIKNTNIAIKAGLSETAYDSITQERGRMIIASSLYNEESHEVSTMQNGLFAHFLLEGLRGAAAERGGAIYINKLFSYIREGLNRYNLQHPFQKAASQDFIIAFVPIAALLQKYFDFIKLQREILNDVQKKFNKNEEIWKSECESLLEHVHNIYDFTQRLYEQLDNGTRLPRQIDTYSVSLIEGLRKTKKLVSDELIPCIKDFIPICRETTASAIKRRDKVGARLISLIESIDDFVIQVQDKKLLYEHQDFIANEKLHAIAALDTQDIATRMTSNTPPKSRSKTNPKSGGNKRNSESTNVKSSQLQSLSDYNQVDSVKLFNVMKPIYQNKHLEVLCFKLNINYDSVRGENAETTIIHLIKEMKAEKRYSELVREILRDHTHVAEDLSDPT